jgi:hypothetical protein
LCLECRSRSYCSSLACSHHHRAQRGCSGAGRHYCWRRQAEEIRALGTDRRRRERGGTEERGLGHARLDVGGVELLDAGVEVADHCFVAEPACKARKEKRKSTTSLRTSAYSTRCALVSTSSFMVIRVSEGAPAALLGPCVWLRTTVCGRWSSVAQWRSEHIYIVMAWDGRN